MDVILKWIGGGTVAAALVLSGIAIGGSATAESEVVTTERDAPQPLAKPLAVAARRCGERRRGRRGGGRGALRVAF